MLLWAWAVARADGPRARRASFSRGEGPVGGGGGARLRPLNWRRCRAWSWASELLDFPFVLSALAPLLVQFLVEFFQLIFVVAFGAG